MTDTVDKIVIQAETQGVQQSTNDVQSLSKAMDGVTVASANVEKSTGSVTSKFLGLERQMKTSEGQAAQLAKVQKTINDAVAANPALQDRANEVLAAATARYGDAAVAEKALGAAHEGLSAQGQAALHSVRSVVEQLALGIPPTQALTGQLNHLTFAATGEGGLKGAFSEVTGLIGGLLTPMRLAVGGAAALGLGALYLGNSWQEAQGKVSQALLGIGERTGTTAADINNFAKANSTATGLSITAARDLGIELTKTGNVAVASLTGVGQAVHGYSILTGKDATQATKDFASAMSGDLVDGIKKLDAPYGSLNADTLEHIRNLDLQSAGTLDASAKTQALQIWIDGLASTNKKAAESVGGLSQAYQLLSNVMAAVKNGPAPTDPRVQAQSALDQATRDRVAGESNAANGGAIISRNANGELTQPTTIGRNANNEFVDVTSGLDDLKKKEADAQAALESLNTKAATAQLRALSEASDDLVHSFLPQIDAIHNLDKAISTLQLAQQKGVAAKGSNDALTVLQYQRDLAQDVLDKNIQQATVVGQLQEKYGDVSAQTAVTLNNLQGQLAVASQRTVQGQIQAQEQAQINDLLAQGTSNEEAASIAAAQRAVSEEHVYQNMQKAVDASKDQVALYATQGTADQAQVKAAIAYRQAIDAGADSTQAGIIATNTATVATAQWADQAQRAAEAFENAARAAHDAQFTDVTPGGDNSFGFFGIKPGQQYTSTSNAGFGIQNVYDELVKPMGDAKTLSDLVSSTLSSGGGINSALDTAKGQQASSQEVAQIYVPGVTKGLVPYSQFGLPDVITKQATSESDIIGQVQQLYDLKNAQTDDQSVKTANLQEEMAWLQSRPETIARDQAIAQLTQSMKDNTSATNANSASLNPLYNGRGALQIGYYKAATGLDMIANGPHVGDQVPFHAMVNGGERITITPPGKSSASNDNSRTVVNNNTFNFGGSQATSRRSQRQVAQGFGQSMAALS